MVVPDFFYTPYDKENVTIYKRKICSLPTADSHKYILFTNIEFNSLNNHKRAENSVTMWKIDKLSPKLIPWGVRVHK